MNTMYFVWTNEAGKVYMIEALAEGRAVGFDMGTGKWGPSQQEPGEMLRKAFIDPDDDMEQVSEAEAIKAGAVPLTEEAVAQALGYPAA